MVWHYRRGMQWFLKLTLVTVSICLLFYAFYCPLTALLSEEVLSPRLDELLIYSLDKHPSPSSSKDLIVILTPNPSRRLVSRLQLLDKNLGDNHSTPLLLLYTGRPNEAHLRAMSNVIRRSLMFLDVTRLFKLFPSDFDPCQARSTFRHRGKWNYQQMIRFWFKILFEMPQFYRYEYIMRLDDDSRVLSPWINVFEEMRARKAVYFANQIDVDEEKQLSGTMKLKYLTLRYINETNIAVKQPALLREGLGQDSLRTYFNNFEVMKLEFFRRESVREWIETVDRTHGIFLYRWGDAILRYITMALFAEPNEVLHRSDYNLSYCHKC